MFDFFSLPAQSERSFLEPCVNTAWLWASRVMRQCDLINLYRVLWVRWQVLPEGLQYYLTSITWGPRPVILKFQGASEHPEVSFTKLTPHLRCFWFNMATTELTNSHFQQAPKWCWGALSKTTPGEQLSSPRLQPYIRTHGLTCQPSVTWCQADWPQLNKGPGRERKWNYCAHLAQIASSVVKRGSGGLPAPIRSQGWRGPSLGYYFFKQESLISTAWKLLQLSLWDAHDGGLKRGSK